MALTAEYGVEYTSIYQTEPSAKVGTHTWHGRMRSMFVSHVQVADGLSAASNVALCKIPPGTVRLILPMSYFYINWTAGTVDFDLGWDAYTDLNGTAVAADPNGLVAALDVENADVFGFEELTAAAGAGAPATTGYTKVFSSKDGVTIRATSSSAGITIGDSIYGVMTIVQD